MSQFEFISRLRRALAGLPEEEIDRAVEYYEDYFADAGVSDEEVTEKLSEYGTLDEGEIQAIKERAQSQPVLSPNNENTARYEQKNEGSQPVTSMDVHNEVDGESAEVQKFVICPKCGEKIWL